MNRKENKIIKLLEKIVEQNQQIIDNLQYKGLGYPWTKPYNPFNHPPYNPYENVPTYTNNVICPHCNKDTGIPMMLHMVIPPEGLRCPYCRKTAVYGNTPICQEPYSTEAVPYTTTLPCDSTTLRPWHTTCGDNTNTSSSAGNSEYRVYNEITHKPEIVGSPNGVTRVVETTKFYDNIYGEPKTMVVGTYTK